MKALDGLNEVEEIRSRFGSLTSADAALWGVMSVGEMVCHVGRAFALAVGETAMSDVEEVKMAVPAAAIKFMALRIPLPWPKSVPTVPQLRRECLPPAGEFEHAKAEAMAGMERFVAFAENRTPHPIFGRMEPGDWMRWGYLHADHHLRQFGR